MTPDVEPPVGRTSLAGAGRTPTERAAALAERVEQTFLGEVRRRLVIEGGTAEVTHPLVFAIVAALLWVSLPPTLVLGWGGVVAGTTAARTWWRRRAGRTGGAVAAFLPGFRLIMGALGLTWGLGAAVIVPQVPFQDFALILVVLSGLVAGATSSLLADPPAFRWFLAGVTAPLPVGILVAGTTRSHTVAAVLVGLFALVMLRLHSRAHQSLVEQLRTAALLKQSEDEATRERFLDALFASAPVAVAVLDSEGRVRGVNPRFEMLFGYTPDDVAGQVLDDLIVPRSELPKATRITQQALRGEVVVAEEERRRKDGRLVPVRVSAARVKGTAGADLFVMYEDASDRRRADAAVTQLANIVQSSNDAIIGQALDGTILTWNTAAERTFGYALSEIKGRPLALLVPPERADELSGIMDRIQRGERVEHFETVHLHKSGRRVPVSLSVSLTKDAQGRISGFSTIARDVSVETAARQAQEAARDVAERAARAQAAFLANMSHEIRTPLNAILGLSELLLDTELSPEQRRSLELVRTSGESLLSILNDVLDFSKIEAEHVSLEAVPFDLPSLVDSTARLLAVRVRDRRLELACDIGSDVPHTVRGDPTRLRQVLTNLIGNAIKFTRQGEVVVTVAGRGVENGRARLRFAVRDTGIGIPTDKLKTIFEEFQQVDDSMTRKYGGTGLGLAISRRLVTLMGGELVVTSQVGRGSEFSFTISLPIETGPPSPILHPGAAVPAGGRVLVVDDNHTSRRIVRETLAAAGLEVSEAADSDAGLAALREARGEGRPFLLAVLDAQLPGRDGFELAAEVRRDRALGDPRLLMLTSAGQRGDAQRCRELGIRGYLPKPIARSELLEATAAVLAGPDPAAGGAALVTRHVIEETRRRMRILLAEDNPVNQEVAATMLRRRGHTVDIVGNGQEAIEAIARTPYDLVLMDIQMPVLDGYAATKAIRARPDGRDLPIVALTAHATVGERERCLVAGMNGYLSKPYQAHELFATVEGWGRADTAPVRPPEPPSGGGPPVDLEGFRRELREAGAEEAVADILATFLENAPRQIEALTSAVASGDAKAVEKAAHAYKSASGTIGARGLAALLKELELAARQGTLPKKGALEKVRAAHRDVVAYVTAERAKATRR